MINSSYKARVGHFQHNQTFFNPSYPAKMAAPVKTKIRLEVDETRIDVEVEKWPSGLSTISHSYESKSPTEIPPTSPHEGPPSKRRRIEVTEEEESLEERMISTEENNNTHCQECGNVRKEDVDSAGDVQDSNEIQHTDEENGALQEQENSEDHNRVRDSTSVADEVQERENMTLERYPLEFREAVKAVHNLVRRNRLAKTSASPHETSSAPASDVLSRTMTPHLSTEVVLLTHSHSSESSYIVLSAHIHVEDANMALLELLAKEHLQSLSRASELWKRTKSLAPPRKGIAWWIDESGTFGLRDRGKATRRPCV